jgi:hypothetical protein
MTWSKAATAARQQSISRWPDFGNGRASTAGLASKGRPSVRREDQAMTLNSRLAALFKPDVVRPATPMDRTTAAAREITEAAARSRRELTARLRATRLEREAFNIPPVKKPTAKRSARKA